VRVDRAQAGKALVEPCEQQQRLAGPLELEQGERREQPLRAVRARLPRTVRIVAPDARLVLPPVADLEAGAVERHLEPVLEFGGERGGCRTRLDRAVPAPDPQAD